MRLPPNPYQGRMLMLARLSALLLLLGGIGMAIAGHQLDSNGLVVAGAICAVVGAGQFLFFGRGSSATP